MMIFDQPFPWSGNASRSCSMRLRLGPLTYLLAAHDDWGKKTLSRLRENLDCIGFDGLPGRIIHLLDFCPSVQEYGELLSGNLPDRFSKILPDPHPRRGWKLTSDQAGHVTWYHQGYPDSMWTNTETPHFHACFQLPWHPILEDMVQLGGSLLHSGLAVVGDQGYLFTAPPGGGKTTTLSRIPPPWHVVADDAVLVWPNGEGAFLAAPLPTWGVLMSGKKSIHGTDRWQVGTAFKIAGVVLLEKAEYEGLTPLPPLEVAPHLYRAFSEHPVVLTNRDPFRKNLFRTACSLSRAVQSWQLELSLEGAFWKLLREVLPNERPSHS
jgi:hypothetical protein